MKTVLFIVEGSVIENVMLQAPTTSETEVLGRSGGVGDVIALGLVFVVLVSALCQVVC
jgi:hypothetical protein